ncbi:copper amine oxidase N-terminal domain-containing protein [Paenibacillus sp. WLX1005]|uniref:copper amine oxidase N-terminal domain-containing protein n=1 Tax=Paenibacillus sp. WLX1005 TaxID=3243766 RepID=UPI0039842532
MLTKKLSIVAVAALFSTVIGLQTTSYAASADIKVTVDQAAVQFPDQKPMMDANRVLIPTRFVAQSLGGKVGYNSATKTVTIQQDSKTITLKINSSKVTAGGKVVTLDVPAKVIKGRTMVPLRFVSEAMGATVDWQQARNLVAITTGSVQTNPVPQPPATTDAFQFDPNFETLGKLLFANNLKEADGKVTFTLPAGATGTYFSDKGAMTELTPGKTYSYDVGKGKGFLSIGYVDPNKKTSIHDQKTSEVYSIFLDASMYADGTGKKNNRNTDKAIVVSDIVINKQIVDKVGTVPEVVALAQNL